MISVLVPAVDQVTVTGHPSPWLLSAMSTCPCMLMRAIASWHRYMVYIDSCTCHSLSCTEVVGRQESTLATQKRTRL